MSHPTRPAGITAAAVLLIVVGGEAVLFAGVGLVRLVWPQFATPLHETSPESDVVWGACFAVLFFWLGSRLLLGKVRSIRSAATLVGVCAGVGLFVLTLCSGFLLVVAALAEHPQPDAEEIVAVVATLVVFWANVIGLWQAMALLQRHAGPYHDWRRQLLSVKMENPP